MGEIELLALLAFVYENRDVTTPPDADLQQASDMLQREGKIHLDVDTCKPIVVDTSSGDADVIVKAINKYRPRAAIDFRVSEPKDMDILSLLNVRSMSRYTYGGGFGTPIRFPRLHGGEVVVQGDVEIQTIIDAVAAAEFEALMSSFVVVSGTVLSCDNDSLDELMRSLRRKVQLNGDDGTFGMLLTGRSDHVAKYAREDVVRSWSIKCVASQGVVTVQVMNMLR